MILLCRPFRSRGSDQLSCGLRFWFPCSRRGHSGAVYEGGQGTGTFIGGGLAAVSRTRAARRAERHAVFVGSGYRAGAFEVEPACEHRTAFQDCLFSVIEP